MTPSAVARHVGAAGVALTGPAALVIRAMRRPGHWSPPPSVTGKSMLAGYVLAVALIEETLYRAPVSRYARHRRQRAASAVAVASTACFVGLHLRRDGRAAAPAHLINACSWTASALVGGTVRWSVASHTMYNYAAMSLRPGR